ncbi:hypothetical protein [Guptibacillus hwajinpoensis]|uniref:hypothetical protein n=1 Tax=Guptibacillus hwajinpoensis TaxID=208199 RepID=UPI003850712B
MAKQIFDYNKSVPTAFSNSIVRNIPRSPSRVTLASFGLYVPNQVSEVEFNATIGVRATSLDPTILITIYRNSMIIFSTRVSIDAGVADYQTISFTAVDNNPPGGYYDYSLRAELDQSLILLDSANAVGPVTFTGISFG